MLILSYNLSTTLTATLKKLDKLRDQLLLTPISPHIESALSWQTTLSHLEGWANLSNQPLTSHAIEDLLTGPGANRQVPTPFIQKAIDYRQALNFVWLEWTANPRPITVDDFRHLAKLLDVSFRHEQEVVSLLGYIQTGNVHPAVQSAITHLYFYPNRLCYLSSLLILYKNGYELNRLVSLEDFWAADKEHYLEVLKQATTQGSITLWLEYFTAALANQIEKTLKNIDLAKLPARLPASLAVLSDRQKSILALADTPGTNLTNRRIQTEFKISQITASRDLAKLAALNFLIPRGRGRSVTYSKL